MGGGGGGSLWQAKFQKTKLTETEREQLHKYLGRAELPLKYSFSSCSTVPTSNNKQGS